jgi:hypothetical protein
MIQSEVAAFRRDFDEFASRVDTRIREFREIRTIFKPGPPLVD